MTTYKKGEIVLAPLIIYPELEEDDDDFLEDELDFEPEYKKRPVIILQGKEVLDYIGCYIVASITSNVARETPYNIIIREREEGYNKTGLLMSSSINLYNITTLPENAIIKRLGVYPFMDKLDGILTSLFDLTIG